MDNKKRERYADLLTVHASVNSFRISMGTEAEPGDMIILSPTGAKELAGLLLTTIATYEESCGNIPCMFEITASVARRNIRLGEKTDEKDLC